AASAVPVVPSRERTASAIARPTTPPASISSPKIVRRPRPRDRSVGTDRKRSAIPAAFVAGLPTGRWRNIRQPRTNNATGEPQAREAQDRVEGGRERRPEAADPVVGRRRFTASGDREEVGVSGVVGEKGQRREKGREHEEDPEDLARDPAAPEVSFEQSDP